jgi:hypothetical protein
MVRKNNSDLPIPRASCLANTASQLPAGLGRDERTIIVPNFDDATAGNCRAQFLAVTFFNKLTEIMDKKKEVRRETPIADGDARPDNPVNNEEVKDNAKRQKPSTGKKFERERESDVNSLEDFKDAN